MHFLVGAPPAVWNQFRKNFLHKVLYNYCSKYFSWNDSVSFYKSKNINFLLCIFKKWFGQGRYIFSSEFLFEKVKHLRMCPSIGGNVGETWLRQGPIITRPYLVALYCLHLCHLVGLYCLHLCHLAGLYCLNIPQVPSRTILPIPLPPGRSILNPSHLVGGYTVYTSATW